jgi:hypothetical protein
VILQEPAEGNSSSESGETDDWFSGFITTRKKTVAKVNGTPSPNSAAAISSDIEDLASPKVAPSYALNSGDHISLPTFSGDERSRSDSSDSSLTDGRRPHVGDARDAEPQLRSDGRELLPTGIYRGKTGNKASGSSKHVGQDRRELFRGKVPPIFAWRAKKGSMDQDRGSPLRDEDLCATILASVHDQLRSTARRGLGKMYNRSYAQTMKELKDTRRSIASIADREPQREQYLNINEAKSIFRAATASVAHGELAEKELVREPWSPCRAFEHSIPLTLR